MNKALYGEHIPVHAEMSQTPGSGVLLNAAPSQSWLPLTAQRSNQPTYHQKMPPYLPPTPQENNCTNHRHKRTYMTRHTLPIIPIPPATTSVSGLALVALLATAVRWSSTVQWEPLVQRRRAERCGRVGFQHSSMPPSRHSRVTGANCALHNRYGRLIEPHVELVLGIAATSERANVMAIRFAVRMGISFDLRISFDPLWMTVHQSTVLCSCGHGTGTTDLTDVTVKVDQRPDGWRAFGLALQVFFLG